MRHASGHSTAVPLEVLARSGSGFDRAPHSGYEIGEEISHGANARIYRALRLRDGQSVVLKIHTEDANENKRARRNRNEQEILQAINSLRVIRCYGAEQFAGSTVLVMEDIGDRSVCDLMANGPLPLEQALTYGCWIAEGLNDIHALDIIHKDISPGNIIVNENNQALKIIDFGQATVLAREQQALVNPGILAGTLAYMSPEQTGRMNRTIDYRSD
jgi:serine/threonine protein kinase